MSSTGPVGSAVSVTSWVRSNAAILVDHRDTLTVIGADGVVRAFEGGSAALVRLVLDILSVPHSQPELEARVRSFDDGVDGEVLVEVVGVLAAAGALMPAPARRRAAVEPARGRIVLGVTGAVAAVDVPALARLLIARGFEVAVMMTESAHKFVTAESLAAITHRPVLSSFWSSDPGQASRPAPHMQLSTWAELVVIYPASAATLARLASGTTEDLVAATVVASEAPVIVAPSMNDAMYRSASVQRNLEQLRQDGFHVVQPRFGHEVATAPHARTALFGAAHSAPEIAQAIELVWTSAVAPHRVDDVETWERQYASTSLERLPWFTDELDGDLAAALTGIAQTGGARRLLDIGTGPGTTAIFAARAGFEVVATDVSATALTLAKRRAQALPIAWMLDDFAASRLWGHFDVAVDRGCLHCLPRAQWPQYVAQAARLLVAGGQLLLKQHAPEEGTRWGTRPLRPEELEQLFGADFTVAELVPSSLPGTLEVAPRALFARLVRR